MLIWAHFTLLHLWIYYKQKKFSTQGVGKLFYYLVIIKAYIAEYIAKLTITLILFFIIPAILFFLLLYYFFITINLIMYFFTYLFILFLAYLSFLSIIHCLY